MKLEGMTRNVREWYRVAFNGDVLWKSTARQWEEMVGSIDFSTRTVCSVEGLAGSQCLRVKKKYQEVCRGHSKKCRRLHWSLACSVWRLCCSEFKRYSKKKKSKRAKMLLKFFNWGQLRKGKQESNCLKVHITEVYGLIPVPLFHLSPYGIGNGNKFI